MFFLFLDKWYEWQLTRYYIKLENLREAREARVASAFDGEGESNIEDDVLLFDLNVKILETEDEEKESLDEKFKNALQRGEKRFGAGIGSLNGFKFVIYSDDHDRHFHVIHRGRGINARFSYPRVELINYKFEGNSLSRKEERAIVEFFEDGENFARLKREFDRRDGINS